MENTGRDPFIYHESEAMSKDLKKQVSNLWGPPYVTPSCKRWGWLMTMWWVVSGIICRDEPLTDINKKDVY